MHPIIPRQRNLRSPGMTGMPALLLALLVATPVRAQYMYLDSNGDGVHTAADVMNQTGTTSIDIWLSTDHNRNGSVATCPVGAYAMTINSYEVCLRAIDGRVTWSDFINRATVMPYELFAGGSGTEFFAVHFGPTINPPGLYRLASLTAQVTQGAPSIQIVTDAPTLAGTAPTPPETAFGSNCPGLNFNNTMTFGTDWMDADGLLSGTAPPGGAPILAAVGDVTVAVGAIATRALLATDPDGDPVTFALQTGPSFADVTTLNPGRGTATGSLSFVPHFDDVGLVSASISASDAISSSTQNIQIHVLAGPNHPPHSTLPGVVRLIAGGTWQRTILAADADGQQVSIEKVEGPDFITAGVVGQGEGGAVCFLRIAPSLCDAGETDALIAVSDGISNVSYPIHLSVRPASPPPPEELVELSTRQFPGGLATGDLNHDGISDLVTANEGNGTISVFLALGAGEFATERTYQVTAATGRPSSVALGDFNEDGHLDVAMGARVARTVTLLFGTGDGRLTAGGASASDVSPEALLVADLNDDLHADLAVGNGGSSTVSIFLGQGNGTFGVRRDIPVSGGPYGLSAGDWNRDGRMDLAVAGSFFAPVSILLGHGDGTYRQPIEFPAGRSPVGTATGDWDGDGAMDLAVADYNGQFLVYKGDGAGGFTLAEDHGGFGAIQSIVAGDLSGDGIDDLVVGDPTGAVAQVFRGDGHGHFSPAERIEPTRGAYQLAIGDMDGDAVPDLAMSDLVYGALFVRRFPAPTGAAGFARAFVQGDHRPVLATPAPALYCARLQPVAGSFTLSQIDLASIALASDGTGSVDRIRAISPKHYVVGDLDHDGEEEISVCFSREDLALLFDAVPGRQRVQARLEGRLLSGRFFCTPLLMDVLGGGGPPLQASISPNPLNPRGVLRFSTSRPGLLRVKLFDLQGRCVRTLADTPLAPAGRQQIEIDGRNAAGQELGSGVYFFRVETGEGHSQGRFSILK